MSNSINHLFNHRQFDPNVIPIIASNLDLRDQANFYTALIGEKPLNEHRFLRDSAREVFERYSDGLESSFSAVQDKNDLLLRRVVVRVATDMPSQFERGLSLAIWIKRCFKNNYPKGLRIIASTKWLDNPEALAYCFKRLLRSGTVKALDWTASMMNDLQRETTVRDNIDYSPEIPSDVDGTPLKVAATHNLNNRGLRFLTTDPRFAPYITQEMVDAAFSVASEKAIDFILSPNCPFKPSLKISSPPFGSLLIVQPIESSEVN